MAEAAASPAPLPTAARKSPERHGRVARTSMTGNTQDDGPGWWRDGRRYSGLRGIDRAGLMWEWLRRDPGYIAWYARASEATRGHAATEIEPVQWGLHFRRASGPRSTRGPDHLACRSRPRHAARHRGAVRSGGPGQHTHRPSRALAGARDR
ncbi:transcriptional regulator domain-containing protein [Sphingosinicella ginsenosidimutans]|uniref:transcriptional regulator domain-containing protein n=1 Tax=Allosphingosinicella ginsenosidimutans TaxID=1176539 RepID=UPI003C73DF5B